MRVSTRMASPAIARLLTPLVAATVVATATGQEHRRLAVADLGGRPVTLDVTIGHVSVRAWDRPGLQADIVPEGSRAGGVLDVALEETAEAVILKAVQRDSGRDARVRTRVTLDLPPAARLTRVAIFEGTLDVEGLRGELRVHVERGDVRARRLGGVIRLETGSGHIDVQDTDLEPAGLIRLRTFNGNIALALTRRPNDARVLALTLNGSIETNLPLETRAGFGPRFREGLFGKGEPLVSLDAVRGNVSIRVPER